jgi:hypothetical protein
VVRACDLKYVGDCRKKDCGLRLALVKKQKQRQKNPQDATWKITKNDQSEGAWVMYLASARQLVKTPELKKKNLKIFE